MPSIITTPSWSTTFSLNTTPKKFVFVDTTDYTTPAIPLAGVRGVFKIVSPSGVTVYNNTSYGAGSDIVANISLTNAITIALPNLANQAPEQGIYTITYTVQITDGANPVYYITSTDTFNFVYSSPTVSIVPQVDCIQPLFTATDTTDYIVNSVTPTNTRTMTLDYPANSGGTPVTNTTSATITTAIFYNGLQAVTVSSILSYSYSNFTVVDTVSGTKSINVDCSYVCQLYCCLKTLNSRKENARGVNDVLFEQLEAQFEEVMSLLELLFLAIDCGKQEDANSYITKIKTIADCADDCSCTDGTPTRVTGLGIQNVNVNVVSGGSPITVTSSTGGGITTYTISFSSSLVTLINSLYNTVVQNLDGTITVSASGIINNVQTYTISANTTTALKSSQYFRCEILFGLFPALTITNSDFEIEGTNMVNATVTDVTAAGGNNLFKVDAFQTVGNDDYKVWIENVQLETQFKTTIGIASTQYYTNEKYKIRVLNQKSNEFYFQLTDIYGVPMTMAAIFGGIDKIRKIRLNILIKK